MVNKRSKIVTKRLPKGQRINIRRMKQEARRESLINNPHTKPGQPTQVQKKQNQD